MRLAKKSIVISTGNALLCDPLVVGDDVSSDSEDAASFHLWEGDGDFTVYTDGECFFIDVDPRILKAGTRPDLTPIPGRVGVDTARIGIYDLTAARLHAADDAIADGWAVVLRDLEAGPYVAWFEEKGTSKELFRGVVGFGPRVRMLLNGDSGQLLQMLEERIAKAYRLKGREKQSEMQSIGDALVALHLDGCKDRRLRMLADAAKVTLPRRPPKRRTT
jgi:hypothetical protein